MTVQTTTFKGARYLVKFHDPIEWASTESYEAIEAVQHEAFTYISKQPVPTGVQIDNEEFWLLWADPNAQMEQLRQLVDTYVENVEDLAKVTAYSFETVIDMKQSADLSVGTICHTNGFHTSGDGGAAWYEISDSLPDGVNEANEMDIIKCGELFANLIVPNTITFEMFGARGNGLTDDSNNIQRAFDIATSIFVPIQVLGKTYIVSKTINVDIADVDKKSFYIFGNGFKSNIQNTVSFDGECVLNMNVSRSNQKSILFDNFKFTLVSPNVDAVRFSATSSAGQISKFTNMWFVDNERTTVKCGIYCTDATCFIIENCAFYYFLYGAGIVIDKCYSSRITNTNFVLNKYGIYLGGGSEITIDKCRIDENTYGIYANDAINDLYPTTRPSGKWEFSSTIWGLNIINNRFENNREFAILLSAWTGVQLYGSDQRVLIEGNYFTGLGCDRDNGTFSDKFKAISVNRICGLTISNNDFRGWKYEETNPVDTQNIYVLSDNTDVTIENNRANLNNTEYGGGKSNSKLPQAMRNQLKFVNDIEVNQTSRAVHSVDNTTVYKVGTVTDGVLDVNNGNVFITPSTKETITDLAYDSVSETNIAKEVTIISGIAGFAMSTNVNITLKEPFDTSTYGKSITLVRARIPSVGWGWFEKCRSL